MAKSESSTLKFCPVCGRPSRYVTCSRSCAAKRRGAQRTYPQLMDRFWAKVEKTDGCWQWTGSRNSDGYGNFHDRGTHSTKAHRFIYERTYGEIPPGYNVCHRCDNPSCVRPDHLFLGTQADNMRDCQRKGRYSRATGQIGSAHHYSKLKESDIPIIRSLRASGVTFKAIGQRFGVRDVTIQNIFNGHTWSHVK
jgi:hypothetical protein